jgi:hypothetical protein
MWLDTHLLTHCIHLTYFAHSIVNHKNMWLELSRHSFTHSLHSLDSPRSLHFLLNHKVHVVGAPKTPSSCQHHWCSRSDRAPHRDHRVRSAHLLTSAGHCKIELTTVGRCTIELIAAAHCSIHIRVSELPWLATGAHCLPHID